MLTAYSTVARPVKAAYFAGWKIFQAVNRNLQSLRKKATDYCLGQGDDKGPGVV